MDLVERTVHTGPLTWRDCYDTRRNATIAANFTSPIANDNIQYGLVNPVHSSTMSIVYTSSTLPTPWPILLAGLLWSLLSAIRGMLPQRSKPSQVIYFSFSVIAFIRCLAALIAACEALATTGGRFRPASAVVVLLLSTLPYALNPRSYRLSRALAAIGTILVFITLSMMIAVRAKDSNNYYAKWVLTGGNCPAIIGKSMLNICPPLYYVGCGLSLPEVAKATDAELRMSFMQPQNPNTFKDTNKLALGETILGLLLIAPFILLGIGFTLFVIATAMYTLWEVFVWLFESFARPFETDWDEGGEDNVRFTATVAVVVILVYIAVSFPLHYDIQTKSRMFVVFDGFGNLQPANLQVGHDYYDSGDIIWSSWTGDSANGTSWGDFFLVQTPTDRLGFLGHWWKTNKVRIMNWIAIL
ncbi:MAG: hypothetical protein M1813_007057 [Trichoglossum hirsutum]|jgi:hypothetical protein|nr:MAG: hypothetical protein M1813_007057 [Trichoglossum hirsutum]